MPHDRKPEPTATFRTDADSTVPPADEVRQEVERLFVEMTRPLPVSPTDDKSQRYRFERLLGEGGFGAVWLASDSKLGRQVAIKVTRGDQEDHKTLASISHSGIVQVYDIYQEGEALHIVMEYIAGQTMRHAISGDNPSMEQRLAWLRWFPDIADALACLHRKRIVHLDLKPENVLIDRQNSPRIVDFGLAIHEATQTLHKGRVAGSTPYMAPEIARGKTHQVDGRSDIWSLGIMMYEVLTGKRPFSGDDIRCEMAGEERLATIKPPSQLNPQVSGPLERICLKCLKYAAEDRYSNADLVANALRSSLQVTPDRRRWLLAGGAATAALVLLSAGIWFSPKPNDRSLLGLHWSGFGQRERHGVWEEFRIQDGMTMNSGDQFRMEFIPTTDSFVYLVNVDSTGSVSVLFPPQSSNSRGPCQANQRYEFPSGNDWLTLDDVIGHEVIYLVASRDRIDALEKLFDSSHGDPSQAEALESVVASLPQTVPTRGVDIRPDARVAETKLNDGRVVRRRMEFQWGGTHFVRQFNFEHQPSSESRNDREEDQPPVPTHCGPAPRDSWPASGSTEPYA